MRRLALALLLWPSIALAQFAPQQWSAPQDGSNFALFDLGSLQVNNFSGGGVQCVESDNAGNFFPVSCSLIGGVSSVTGTAGHISVSPTTGAVVVDLIATSVIPGSYTYAAFTVDADGRLTAVSSGTAPITSVVGTSPISCSGSPTATCSITGGTNQVQVGTGTNIGGTNDFRFDDSIGVTFQSKSQNASTLNFISNSNAGATALAGTQWSQSATINTAPYAQISVLGSGYSGAQPGSAIFTHVTTSALQQLIFLEFGTGSIAFNTTTSNTNRLLIENGGNVDVANLSNGMVKAIGGIGTLATAVAGTDYQAPLTACTDYVSVSCQGGTSDIGTAGSNSAVRAIALHDGGAVRHSTSGTWANNAPVAIDGSGNIVAKTPGSCITCTGGTCDVFNGQCGGASTLGGVGQVIQQATHDSYGKFQGGNAVAGSSLFTKIQYWDAVSLTSDIALGQWLLTSSTQFGVCSGGTCINGELPNDFIAGHAQLRLNYILPCTGASATGVTCFVTRNGSGVAGTGLTFQCGTTPAGIQVGTVQSTGSASATDTYGVQCSALAGLAGQIDTFSTELLLTP